jgi:hypothetical protein
MSCIHTGQLKRAHDIEWLEFETPELVISPRILKKLESVSAHPHIELICGSVFQEEFVRRPLANTSGVVPYLLVVRPLGQLQPRTSGNLLGPELASRAADHPLLILRKDYANARDAQAELDLETPETNRHKRDTPDQLVLAHESTASASESVALNQEVRGIPHYVLELDH